MPTQGELQLNPGVASNPKSGYRSAFSHANEVAQAGYYKVKLDDHGILAELTASNRVGFHQYTFPKSDQSHIILDLTHGIYNYDDKVVWTYVRVVNDTLITGYRQPTAGPAPAQCISRFRFPNHLSHTVRRIWINHRSYKGFWRKFDQTRTSLS